MNDYWRKKINKMYRKRGEQPLHEQKLVSQVGKIMKKSGPRGPYPHVWKTGPDPETHEQFIHWHRHRAQAHFRKEAYNLTFDEFKEIWGDKWVRRGRHNDDYCMTRQNKSLPWDRDNAIVILRLEQLQTRLKK